MALGGFLCPFCNYYNANDATVCARCEKRLPPPGLAGPLRSLLSIDLWATKLLAGISVVVFALQLASAGSMGGLGITGMPLSTLLRFGAMSNFLGAEEPFRLLASCFVHMGVLHVGMNMMALANLGRLIEPEIKGPRFLIAYVLTGIAGFAATLWWYGEKPYVTAGASGAIFGLEGLLIGAMVAKRDPRWKAMVKQMVVSSVILALILPVNNSAHAGGFLAGLVLGAFTEKESRPWKIASLVNGFTAICLIAIAVSLYLPQRSPTWRAAKLAEEARDQRRTQPQPIREDEIIER
jgi:membrane associated rhomboid family serine protease